MPFQKRIYRTSYFSNIAIPLEIRANEISTIVSAARIHNKQQRITGALSHVKNYFIQVLEGPEASVRETLRRIVDDPRHNNVRIYQEGFFNSRLFSDWSLAFASMNSPDEKACFQLLEKTAAGSHLDVTAIEEILLKWSEEI